MAKLLQKKEEVYGSKTYWRELGYYVSRREHYEKSLKYFDSAIKSAPDNRRALVGRSKSRAKSCQIKGALEDIEKALELDPQHLPTLHEKAHNTYLSCEFEEALIQNSRLLKFRTKPDYFHIGKITADATIENCVGDSAGKPLRDHFEIIRKIAWKRNYDVEKTLQPVPKMKKKTAKHGQLRKKLHEPVRPKAASKDDRASESNKASVNLVESLCSYKAEKYPIPHLDERYGFTPLQKYTTNIKNFMAEKYLDHMYLDKAFLKDMQKHRGVTCPNEAGSNKLIGLAKAAYSDVARKQEILRHRRPFYHIKYEEANLSGTLKSRLNEELVLQQQTAKREAEKLLTRLRDSCRDRNLNALLDVAEKLKVYCDSKPKRLLPEKGDYMREVYEMIRRGFYQQNRLNSSQFRWDQDKRICVSFGMAISREPSSDSVICQFENKLTDFDNLISVYEARLEKAEQIEEICWYYHELARFKMEAKQYEHARTYAKKCCQEAKAADLLEWALNGRMLLVRIHVRQQNKEDALQEVSQANALADELKDQRLKEYLIRCRSVISELNFELETADAKIKTRERHIMNLMKDDKVRNEFAHLFRTMAALPAKRRMTVLPGVRLGSEEKRGKAPMKSAASKKSVTSRRSMKSISGWGGDVDDEDSNLLSSLQFYL